MRKTLVKTVIYRAISMSQTMGLAYCLTGSAKFASAFGLINLTVNSSVYFAFERAWTALERRERNVAKLIAWLLAAVERVILPTPAEVDIYFRSGGTF